MSKGSAHAIKNGERVSPMHTEGADFIKNLKG